MRIILIVLLFVGIIRAEDLDNGFKSNTGITTEVAVKTIEITGVCHESVVADTYQISINVVAENNSAESANNAMYKKHNDIINKIKATSLKKYTLETAKISTDIKEQTNKPSYVSRASINFITNNKKDLKYIAGLIAKEKQTKSLLVYYSGYAYGFSNSLLNQVRLSCLDIAHEDAKAKAKILAQNNGFTLGEIIKITD